MRKKMSELVAGDVVRVYGLRVRVEEMKSRELTASYDADIREGLIAEGHKPYTYWTVGTVLNADEAISNGFPRGYLTKSGNVLTWTLAGNDRRTVTVEESE